MPWSRNTIDYQGGFQLPPDSFEAIPNGATVVGMNPEVNVYKDVYFHDWFGPNLAELFNAEYCIYYDAAVPCNTEDCFLNKTIFWNMCEPIYTNDELNLTVGLTRRPFVEPV